MAERLKSISRQIHWSSLLKAGIFATAWGFLPGWLFAIIALFLYFRPWFRVGRLIAPFFALIILALVTGTGLPMAVIFGAIFYLMLLIKDLLILDRQSGYEVLVLALALLYLRHFYASFSLGVSGVAFFWAFVVAAVIAILFRNFVGASSEDKTASADDTRRRRAAGWLVFFLLTQLIIVGLFLPIDFIYQTVIVFLVAVFLIDLFGEYLIAGLSRNKILGTASVLGSLFIIIIASARWWL